MAKLSTYTNNLFATHATLDSALSYAQDVADGSDSPAAVMAAVQAVLNTAISMHHAEMSAVNRPLIELIDARVAAAVADLRSEIDESNLAVDSRIDAAINDMDIDDKIQGWYDSNFDIESALSGTSISITFD